MKRIIKLITLIVVFIVPFLIFNISLKEPKIIFSKESNALEYKANIAKPSAPNIETLTSDNGAVQVRCEGTSHSIKYTNLIGHSNGYNKEVLENDGANPTFTKEEYPWMLAITLDDQYWVNRYNSKYQSSKGTHVLDTSKTQKDSMRLYYNGVQWMYTGDMVPMIIYVKHQLTSYSIVHEYYTNGKKDGEVVENVEDVEVGRVIEVKNLEKKLNYEEKEYKYKLSNPESLTLTDNLSSNAITLRYEREEKYQVIYTDGVEDEVLFSDQQYKDLEPEVDTPNFREIIGKTQKLEDGTIIPKREGYTFEGWSPSVNPTISSENADEKGRIYYSAEWKKITDKVDESENKEPENSNNKEDNSTDKAENPSTSDNVINLLIILLLSLILLTIAIIKKKRLI